MERSTCLHLHHFYIDYLCNNTLSLHIDTQKHTRTARTHTYTHMCTQHTLIIWHDSCGGMYTVYYTAHSVEAHLIHYINN